MQEKKTNEGYFDQPRTKKLLWGILIGMCTLSVALEPFIHRKSHFSIDNFFGFYAVLGFIACTGCILIAKCLGLILKKKVEYYDHDK